MSNSYLVVQREFNFIFQFFDIIIRRRHVTGEPKLLDLPTHDSPVLLLSILKIVSKFNKILLL